MRIVSSRTEKEIATERALQDLSWPLRELAANMMRISRGAGRPESLVEHFAAAGQALNAYRDIAGCWPAPEDFHSILNLDATSPEGLREHWQQWDYAMRTMVKGALRIAAANLIGPVNQETAGERELFEGLTVIERIREQNRREVMAAATTRKAIPRKPRAKTPIKRK